MRAAPALSRDSERGEGEGRSLGSVPSPAPDPLALYPGPSQETFERWHRRLGPVLRYLYRVKGIDLENIPKTGGALLLSNHASYADVLLLSLAVGRPIRFVMAKNLYESPYLHWFAKKFGAIPIAHRGAGGTREDTARALAAARAAAEGGELVAIFAEGAMTRHGMLSKFRRGFEDVARDLKAPVIPVYIDGLWGALMSYKPKTLWQRVSRSPKDVTVVAGRPLPQADIPRLYDALMELGARAFAARVESGKEPLAQEFLSAAKSHWLRTAVEESSGRTSYGRLLTSAALLSGRLGPAAPGRGAVAVLLPPSAQAARVNLAIAILGRPAANLPEPADAAALLESMRAAGAARIVATRSDVARRPELASAAERFLFLEDLEADITGPLFWREYARLALRSEDRIRRETFARAAASLDDVAAVVFKTGRSSAAVRLTHRQVQASIEMLREVYTLSRYPKTLGVVPFDRALGYATGFALPFTLGKTAAYPSGPREVGYAARGAGLLVASPEQLEAYTAEVPRRALRSLGLVIAAGAAMPLSSVQAFERRFGKKVLRAYGMAEAAGLVSVNVPYEDRLHANPEKKLVRNRPDTVGHFLPGVAVKLVDPETMEPVGFGAPGLLLLKGANISPDAFATRDGWFVTGDFAAMDKDGYLTLLGPQ
ncbi:MAG: AMP-binding protein [Proteobacteria bacterium]|nr:AMP-binding protein [Pseudomonadota bacterium]